MNHYLTAMEIMTGLFETQQVSLASFNRKDYAPAFEAFYMQVLPAFDSIEELYKTVGEPQEMLSNMVDAAISKVQEKMGALSKRKQNQEMIDKNLQLAVFIYPAILRYKGESSQPLLEIFKAKWKEAFPQSNVTPASFDEIQQGFHRKFCYISTAVCENTGLADDCYELNLLRNYRDGYMASLPDGEDLIRRYYDVSPTIVKHISARDDASAIYSRIWEEYLQPCIHLIEDGKNEECCELYQDMVNTLKNAYFFA